MEKRPFASITIPVSDLKTAQQFYSEIFGWTFEPSPNTPDSIIFESGNVKGALIPPSAAQPVGHIGAALASDDIDTDLDRIRLLGGQVQVPKTETPVSWFAVFTDPGGNSLALFKLKD